MVRRNDTPAAADPVQNPIIFKGHPQPPIEERLEQCKNFLADEDANRCLGFSSKLAEIEEFISYIEAENLPRNRCLFGDVKTMVQVHKDWMERMDKIPADIEGPHAAPSVQNYSSRLISAESAARFKLEQEASGLITQMRKDHPPFTVERSDDQVEFLRKMSRDACTNPDECDSSNLLFVEHRAYNLALREPSLVPFWLHWSKVLSTKGIKPSDPLPWYCRCITQNIPLRELLPDYLQRRQDEINRLLRISSPGVPNKDSDQLVDLLSFHAPPSLQQLRDECNYLESIHELLTAQERLDLSSMMSILQKKLREWTGTIRHSGVQLKLSYVHGIDPHLPGVFYLADGQPTVRDNLRLQEREDRINLLLTSPELLAEEREQLRKDLDELVPANIRKFDDRAQAILIRAGKRTKTSFNLMSTVQRGAFNKTQLEALDESNQQEYNFTKAERNRTFDTWLANLRLTSVKLRYLRPGEIATESPSNLYLPWSPRIEPPLELPPQHVRQLESEINDLLYTMEINKITVADQTRLDELLVSIMYSGLQKARTIYMDLEQKHVLNSLNSVEAELYPLLRVRYNLEFLLWRECLLSRKAQIRMPQDGPSLDFHPGVLYYRGHYHDLIDPDPSRVVDFNQWAERINASRRAYSGRHVRKPEEPLSLEDEAMYVHLSRLQYPALKRMDSAWRDLCAIPSSNENTVRELKSLWERNFIDWLEVLSFHDGPFTIRQADPDDETLGDPSVVYYRGPRSSQTIQSNVQDPTLPPEGIQQQINQIHLLLQKYAKRPSKNILEELKKLLGDFWRPAREYEDYLELVKDQKHTYEAEKDARARQEEFERRLLLFIQESTKDGFRVGKLQSGGYEAVDTTATLVEHWRICGDGLSSVHNPQYFKKLLKTLWLYPRRFYRTLRDLEIEINERLQALSQSHPPTGEENARLLQLLRPLLPYSLAELDHQLEFLEGGSFYDASGQDNIAVQKSFVALCGQWLRQLQRCARTRWIEILVWDRAEWSSESFAELEGRLYYPKPQDCNALVGLEDTPTGELPVRMRRYQDEINSLLKKRKCRPPSSDQTPLSWHESDRLRQLLRLVMDTTTAKADEELWDLDEKSRVELLQGEELTSFLSQFEAWHVKYNQWVNSFPEEGIELKNLSEGTPQHSSNSGACFVHMGNDLPPAFRKRSLPLHVQRMTREFNTALRAPNLTPSERNAVYTQYLPLIKATYRQDIYDLREYYLLSQFPENSHRESRAPPTLEMEAVLQCVGNLALRVAWDRMREIAITGRQTGTSMEIYEPVRGELRIRGVPAAFQTVATDQKGASVVKMPVSRVSFITLPGFDEARNEYFPLAAKVRNEEAITGAERAEIVRLLRPLSEREQQAAAEQAVSLALKLFDGKELTDIDMAQAKDLILRSLWQQYGKISVGLVERVFPELQFLKSVERLLDRTSLTTGKRNATLVPAPAEAEVRELGIEINSLLQKARDWTISDAENQILDHLLRPLVNDRLRELDRQMENLTLKPTTNGSAVPSYQEFDPNPGQSLYLIELQTQWREEFQKWKKSIPGSGVIIDEWFSEPDVISNVVRRFRGVREALSEPPLRDSRDRNFLNIFQVLKKYITDSNFSDGEDKLMLERMPTDLAALRDILFDQRRIWSSRNRKLSLCESLSLNLMERDFVSRYMSWYNTVPLNETTAPAVVKKEPDFSGKAERRGVQRAAIELALNLLATNQEQHRPHDKFRRVELPPRFQPPVKEVSMCSALEPWKRPVEQDPFKITKLLLRYRKWKDNDYRIARSCAMDTLPCHLEPPINFNGPCTLHTEHDLYSGVKKRHNQLVQIQSYLIHAGKIAPRPLIHRLTTIINEALVLSSNDLSQPRIENEGKDKPVEKRDIDILRGLCAPSWNEERRPYPDLITGVDDAQGEIARLNEFERDVNLFMEELPIWEPSEPVLSMSMDPNQPEFYIQTPYDSEQESITGWDLDTLINVKVNTSRQGRTQNDNPARMWTKLEAIKYLKEMHNTGRVHFDSTPGRQLVSRIPPSGHPENKYIVTPESVRDRTFIRFNDALNQWQVQYDSAGQVGKPVLQPNFYEYLQTIAYRVGRDIRLLHNKISGDHREVERLEDQFDVLRLTRDLMDSLITDGNGVRLPYPIDRRPSTGKEVSIRKIARDLHRVAPDLVDEAQVNLDEDLITESEKGSATVIQMQLIQESNNNWDSRFPENENVWDFADSRLSLGPDGRSERGMAILHRNFQYFNMRRWPLWKQSKEVQTEIESSNLVIQEKLAPPTSPCLNVRAKRKNDIMDAPKREQYTGRGGPAMFPFGETPYQQAYLSWRMEEDLKDVEEFKPKPSQRSIFSRRPKVEEESPIDYFQLPTIPTGWQPDSVSLQEKWYDVTERVRNSEGFPRNLQYYYTDGELVSIKSHETYMLDVKLRAEARALVEAHERRPYEELTGAQIRAAQLALGINPQTETVTRKPAPSATPGVVSVISKLFKKWKADATPIAKPNSNNERTGQAMDVADGAEDGDVEDIMWLDI